MRCRKLPSLSGSMDLFSSPLQLLVNRPAGITSVGDLPPPDL